MAEGCFQSSRPVLEGLNLMYFTKSSWSLNRLKKIGGNTSTEIGLQVMKRDYIQYTKFENAFSPTQNFREINGIFFFFFERPIILTFREINKLSISQFSVKSITSFYCAQPISRIFREFNKHFYALLNFTNFPRSHM